MKYIHRDFFSLFKSTFFLLLVIIRVNENFINVGKRMMDCRLINHLQLNCKKLEIEREKGCFENNKKFCKIKNGLK